MSKQVFRDLQKMFKRHACVVTKFEVSGRNTLKVWLMAPDASTVEMFSFSNETGSATKYQQGNEQMVKRFALAHPAPVVRTVPPKVGEFKTVAALSKPTFELKPYQVAVLDEITRHSQPEDKPMPTTATMPVPDTTAAGASQEKRLDRKQFHQLTKWCTQNVPQGIDTTLVNLAREASAHLGFAIAESTMKEALDLEEIKLAEPRAKVPQDRTWALACVLKNLMVELKLDVPEVLQAIVERRSVR